jgi:hypothetical protein
VFNTESTNAQAIALLAAVMLNALDKPAATRKRVNFMAIVMVMIALLSACSSFASTQGLNQIATPDMPPEGDLSLSFQVQDQKLGNPYQVQAEMGLTKWFEMRSSRVSSLTN